MILPTLHTIPHNTSKYFTHESPLGPSDAGAISDHEVSNYLLNPETESFRSVLTGASIIVGRRGAGKSALVLALKNKAALRQYLIDYQSGSSEFKVHADLTDLEAEHVTVITIPAHIEMAEVSTLLRRRGTALGPELGADIWRGRLWMYVVKELLRDSKLTQRLTKKTRQLISDIKRLRDEDSLAQLDAAELRRIMNSLSVNKVALIESLRQEFVGLGLKVLFLIDSIDEYRIKEDIVPDVLGGLLHLVATVDPVAHPEVFKVALPSEVYRALRDAANPARVGPRLELITWKPIHLVKIVSHRLLISARIRDDQLLMELQKACKPHERGSRKWVQALWRKVFGDTVVDECGRPESSVSFLLRHTQLIPRHLILFIENFIKEQRKRTGEWGTIEPKTMLDVLPAACESVVRQVSYGYKHVYPGAAQVFEAYLPRCELVMTEGELQRLFHKSALRASGQEYTNSFPSFFRALIEMGVVGKLEDETGRYWKARFDYNSPAGISYNERDRFCIHPAFSNKYLSRIQCASSGKVVLPIGNIDGFEEDI